MDVSDELSFSHAFCACLFCLQAPRKISLENWCIGQHRAVIACLPVCLAFKLWRILRWRIDVSDDISFGNNLSACLFGPPGPKEYRVGDTYLSYIILINGLSVCSFCIHALKNIALENWCHISIVFNTHRYMDTNTHIWLDITLSRSIIPHINSSNDRSILNVSPI